MSRTSHLASAEAQARAEARRALKAGGIVREPRPVALPSDEPLVFVDQVLIGLVEDGFLIPRSRVDAVLELLGIPDTEGVVALQIDTDLQVTVVRRRHANHPDGGHLVRLCTPILNTQERA